MINELTTFDPMHPSHCRQTWVIGGRAFGELGEPSMFKQ